MLLSENGDWEDSVGRRQLLVRNHVTLFVIIEFTYCLTIFPAILRDKIDRYLHVMCIDTVKSSLVKIF